MLNDERRVGWSWETLKKLRVGHAGSVCASVWRVMRPYHANCTLGGVGAQQLLHLRLRGLHSQTLLESPSGLFAGAAIKAVTEKP